MDRLDKKVNKIESSDSAENYFVRFFIYRWTFVPTPATPPYMPFGIRQFSKYSMKIKEQTRKLAADSLKHCFEVADKTDGVNYKTLL